jgi:hypothetical protein
LVATTYLRQILMQVLFSCLISYQVNTGYQHNLKGAMENWGLVLYRETALLFDEEKSLLEDEFFVMLVICHDISHSVSKF